MVTSPIAMHVHVKSTNTATCLRPGERWTDGMRARACERRAWVHPREPPPGPSERRPGAIVPSFLNVTAGCVYDEMKMRRREMQGRKRQRGERGGVRQEGEKQNEDQVTGSGNFAGPTVEVRAGRMCFGWRRRLRTTAPLGRRPRIPRRLRST